MIKSMPRSTLFQFSCRGQFFMGGRHWNMESE